MRLVRILKLFVLWIIFVFTLTACSDVSSALSLNTQTPTLTSTSTPTPSPTPTMTPLPTPTPAGGGTGLVFVEHMQDFSPWVKGRSSGIKSDCYFDTFDTSGNQISPLTKCDYEQNKLMYSLDPEGPYLTYSDSGSINLCLADVCNVADDLFPAATFYFRNLSEEEHTELFWLPGSAKQKILDLLYHDSLREKTDIYLSDLSTNKTSLIIEGADLSSYRSLPNYNISPDGRWIIYRKSRPDEMSYIAATDGSSNRPLVKLESSADLPFWSNDSKSIYWLYTPEAGFKTGKFNQKVVRLDPESLDMETLVEGDLIFGGPMLNPGSDECFESAFSKILYCGYFSVDLTQSPAVITPLIKEAYERQVIYSTYSLSPDQTKAIYEVRDVNMDNRFLGYYLLDAKTGALTQFDDLASIGPWSPDSNLVLGVDVDIYDKGERNLYIINVNDMSVVVKIPQGTDPVGSVLWLKN